MLALSLTMALGQETPGGYLARGLGGFKLGEHVVLPEGKFERVKACNLLLSMLQNFGLEVDRFGTSTGSLAGLEWKSA